LVPHHDVPYAKEPRADLQRHQDEGIVTVANDADEEKTRLAMNHPGRAEKALTELPRNLKEEVGVIIDNYDRIYHRGLLKAVHQKYLALARKSRLRRTST
jgi:hypothetical protein